MQWVRQRRRAGRGDVCSGRRRWHSPTTLARAQSTAFEAVAAVAAAARVSSAMAGTRRCADVLESPRRRFLGAARLTMAAVCLMPAALRRGAAI